MVDRSNPCPCGSGGGLAECCAPILAGAPAPTALALMRSRYTAYTQTAMDYLVASHAPETRAAIDLPAATQWAAETRWLGLEIVASERGRAGDRDGVVEFIARGITRGKRFAMRERSRFRRVGEHWYYVDGDHPAA